MKLLLNTHALLWWLADDRRIGPRTCGLIEDPVNDVLVSMASLWEIVVKIRVGKLQADVQEIAGAVERLGMTYLAITPEHLLRLVDLPMHHRDPFDHLLMAQAIAEDATFVSSDQHVGSYTLDHLPCSA